MVYGEGRGGEEQAEGRFKTEIPSSKYDLEAKMDACVDLTLWRVFYSSLAGAFTGLLLFRSPVTRWASVAFGAGVGVGSAYIESSYTFGGAPTKWSTQNASVIPFTHFEMEHGSLTDASSSTFSLLDEDHTLANSVRYTLNKDPRVSFCGYSIPHPSDNRVNIRVQTTGDPAKDVFKDSLQDLMVICQHVRTTFDKAVADFQSEPTFGENAD